MTDISSSPLLKQAYDVCLASDLMRAIDVHLQAARPALAPPKVEAIQGEAISFVLDPLAQAIESTARVFRDEHEHLAHISMTLSGDVPLSPVYKRMSAHLEALLTQQLKRVGDDGHQ